MKPASLPHQDDRIGKKIDFLVKAMVWPALKPAGFLCQARNVYRTIQADHGEVRQVINFQGSKWNEGCFGQFCLNLSIFFPAIARLLTEMPSYAWHSSHLDRIDEAYGHIRNRLSHLIPGQREPWWPKEMSFDQPFWFEIDRSTDLSGLGVQLCRIVTQYILPWFEKNSSYKKLINFDEKTMIPVSPIVRVAAAIIAGDEAGGSLLLNQYLTARKAAGETDAEVLAWARLHGITPSSVQS